MSDPSTEVHRSVTVAAPPERAYRLFIERFDQVKPRDHNIMPSPVVETIFTERVGGTIYDRCEDGSECHWARVLELDPPHRLVFSWDIGPTWQLVADPAQASEVEVTFTSEGEAATRVDLVHRHLDRHGPGWPAVRGGVDAGGGWPLYLARYASAVAAAA